MKLKEVYNQCDYGDLFLLFQIRQRLTNIQMFELLMLLQDQDSALQKLNPFDNHSDTTEELEFTNCNSGPENPNFDSRKGYLPQTLSSLDVPKYMMDSNSNKPLKR